MLKKLMGRWFGWRYAWLRDHSDRLKVVRAYNARPRLHPDDGWPSSAGRGEEVNRGTL